MDGRQFGLKAPLPHQPQGTPAAGLIWAPAVGAKPGEEVLPQTKKRRWWRGHLFA